MIEVVLRIDDGNSNGHFKQVSVDADTVTFIEASGFIEMSKEGKAKASFNSNDVVYFEEVAE